MGQGWTQKSGLSIQAIKYWPKNKNKKGEKKMEKLRNQFIESLEGEDFSCFSKSELVDYLEEAKSLGVSGAIVEELEQALKENGRKNEFIYLYKGENFIQSYDTMNDLLHNLKIDRSNFTRLRDKIEDGFTYKGYKMIKTSSI